MQYFLSPVCGHGVPVHRRHSTRNTGEPFWLMLTSTDPCSLHCICLCFDGLKMFKCINKRFRCVVVNISSYESTGLGLNPNPSSWRIVGPVVHTPFRNNR